MFWAHWDVPNRLTAQAEQALKPGDTFKECAICPEMVVVPAGSFIMGSPANEAGRSTRSTARGYHPPAVRCRQVRDHLRRLVSLRGAWRMQLFFRSATLWAGLGADRQPVINVSWNDAKQYVAWLSKLTGKPYRFDRGGMGVCRTGRNADGVFMGRRDWQGQRQLLRLRQRLGQRKPPRSAHSRRMRLGSTTCTAMFGSGSRIATTTTTMGRPRTDRPGPWI